MEEYPQINVPNDLLEFDFEKDGSTDLLLYLFGIYDLNKPPRFDPRMEVNIPKGHVHNDQPIRTSMGNYIYNRVLLDDDLLREVGFVNYKFSSKVYKKLANNVVEAFADGRVKVQSVIKFIDNSELYGFGRCDAFVSSITPKIAFVDERVKKRKKELLLQYRKEIAEGDTNAAVAIRDELIKVAKECIGNDPGLDLFESSVNNTALPKDSIMLGWTDVKWNSTFEDVQTVEDVLSELDDMVKEEPALIDEYFYKLIEIGEDGRTREETNDENGKFVSDFYVIQDFSI